MKEMANKDNSRTSAESYRDNRKARLAQSAKKNKKKSEKSKAIAKTVKTVVAIVLAVAIAFGIVWKIVDDTAVIKKHTTVITVGDKSSDAAVDMKISETEFIYYYNQYLSNIYTYAQQYAMYGYNIGIDASKSPDEQDYGTDENGNSIKLSKYIEDETIDTLQTCKILYNEAVKAGYELTADEQNDIDEQIEELRTTAAENNYSLNSYLRASQGKGVNEKFLREQLKMQTIVSRYQTDLATYLTNSYSDAEIKAVYDANTSDYNNVDARTFTFAVEALTANDGETDEQLATRQKAANEKLKAKAEAMKKASTSEKAFLDQATKNTSSSDSYDADSSTALNETSKSTITSYISEDAAKWAFDSSRKAGDVQVFTVGSGDDVLSYVVLYIVKPSYAGLASNVRHILVSFTDDTSSSSEATDEQKEVAKKTADELYAQWKNGEKTEDSFAALAKEKSADTGSAADGGLISGITSTSSYVESFRNWAVDSSRKVGDTGIIESTYGYHIMYFCGKDYAWKDTIRSNKASEDFEKKIEDFKASDEYKLTKKDKKLDRALRSYLKEFKENLAMSNSSSSY